MSEGYVKNTLTTSGTPTFDYVYQYKDHLGNVRVSYTQDPEVKHLIILEEAHYYPFGLQHTHYNTDLYKISRKEEQNSGGDKKSVAQFSKEATPFANPGYNYKFNGKELQDELGLDWYDFGLRQYDPALGRFLQMDPMTHHNQSPFVAFDNNPVVFVDPDGADSKDPIKETVTLITSSVDKSNVTHITQTTTNTTTTINDDGSVNVAYSTASITNTVDAYGNATNGTNVTESSGTITRDAVGKVSSTAGKTTTRNAKEGDSTSALGEWTSTVSSYNKSNDGIYNVDMINKTADATTRATKIGVAVLGGFTAANSLTKGLSPQAESLLAGLGISTSTEGLIGQAGEALKDMVGKNNSHAILYGVQHIQNGTMMKAMKTPSGNGAGERKRVGPTSFQGLWKGIKSLFD